MGSFLLLLRRELGAYFSSAMAYVVFTAYVIMTGLMFYGMLVDNATRSLPVRFDYAFSFIGYVFAFITPLITMRLIAEEKSQGTMETLMTSPISDLQFVLSKFAASLVFLHFLLIVPLLGYPLIMSHYAHLDPGSIFSSYLGMVLLCAALFSIGLFVSSLCRSQISAGVVTLMLVLLMTLVPWASSSLTEGSRFRGILERADVLGAMQPFLKGVIDSRPVVLYVSVASFFIFLTVRVMDSRKWR